MTHPEELLAAFVDGTLAEADRRTVERHLAGCARCAAEVAEARAGVTALRKLPQAAAPPGLADAARREAEPASREIGRRSEVPRWQRWGVPALAAAAVVLLLALVLPRVGGGGAGSADRAAPAAVSASSAPEAAAVPLEIQGTDYRSDALSTLATTTATALAGGAPAEGGSAPTRAAGSADATAGAACIQRAFRQVPGALVRMILARFEGTPAYIALYAEGPGAGQPADAVTVRVADAQRCRALSIAQVPI